jgi:hypothetical protein
MLVRWNLLSWSSTIIYHIFYRTSKNLLIYTLPHVGWYMHKEWRVLVRMIGFISTLVTISLNHIYIQAIQRYRWFINVVIHCYTHISPLHNLQFLCRVFTTCLLEMNLSMGDYSVSAAQWRGDVVIYCFACITNISLTWAWICRPYVYILTIARGCCKRSKQGCDITSSLQSFILQLSNLQINSLNLFVKVIFTSL